MRPPRVLVSGHFASVLARNSPHVSEPKSGAAGDIRATGIEPGEGFKDVVSLVRWDAWPVVVDPQPEALLLQSPRDLHTPVRETHGI